MTAMSKAPTTAANPTPASEGPLLALSNVEVRYQGTILALKGVSLEIERGQSVALLGPNGAGKTTILRAISNLLRPQKGAVTGGRVEIDGTSSLGWNATATVQRGVVQVLEGRRVLTHLSVDQNLRVAGAASRRSAKELAADVEGVKTMFPDLRRLEGAKAGFLSGGQQQMLVLGRALISRPRLLLLDEPSLGLSPVVTQQIFGAIRDLNKDGLSILVVEQNAHQALGVAEYGYVLETGQVVLEGAAQALLDNPDLQEFYLGLNHDGRRAVYGQGKRYKRRKRWVG
jgi:branched-chain amino acid transport system ATP-binding protein